MTDKLHVHQRYMLKSKDKKKIFEKLKKIIPGGIVELEKIISKKSKVEFVKIGDNEELYAIDGKLTFWLKNGKLIPLLSYLFKHETSFKSVIVDEGAIRFVAKGADTMRPGITTIDSSIKKGDTVLIKDPNHGKTLAVGEALFDADEMEKKETGKVIKAIHYVKDKIWEFSETF